MSKDISGDLYKIGITKEPPPKPIKKTFPNIDHYISYVPDRVIMTHYTLKMYDALKKGNILFYADTNDAAQWFYNRMREHGNICIYIVIPSTCSKRERNRTIKQYSHAKKPAILITTDEIGRGIWKSVKVIINEKIPFEPDEKAFLRMYKNRIRHIIPDPKGVVVNFSQAKYNEDQTFVPSYYFDFPYILLPKNYEQIIAQIDLKPEEKPGTSRQ